MTVLMTERDTERRYLNRIHSHVTADKKLRKLYLALKIAKDLCATSGVTGYSGWVRLGVGAASCRDP
ncbi:hypothetical protein J6590_013545 [Homalodisca vitripennis]|nr:hypothetical protein J6590_013545 [Homalodisca vitripennis]